MVVSPVMVVGASDFFTNKTQITKISQDTTLWSKPNIFFFLFYNSKGRGHQTTSDRHTDIPDTKVDQIGTRFMGKRAAFMIGLV